MPVFLLYGIPQELRDSAELTSLALEYLPMAASSIPEMGITPQVVTVIVPGDLVNEGLGEEIIVFVEGLFMREERTAEVRQRFAEEVRDCVRNFALEHVPDCRKIEVVPRSQRPDDGFAEWRKDA